MVGCKVDGCSSPERLWEGLYEVMQELGNKNRFMWEHTEESREYLIGGLYVW